MASVYSQSWKRLSSQYGFFFYYTERTPKATVQVVQGVDATNEAHAGSSAAPGEQAETSVDKPESNSTPSPEQYVVLLLSYLM